MKKGLFALLGLSIVLTVILSSCGVAGNSEPLQQTSSSGASTVIVGKQFHIPVNAEGNTAEQQNIMDRQKITSDPTKIMWMHLVDFNGRIYLRTPVRGKVTSSGKRLEPISVAAGATGTGGYTTYEYGAQTPDHQHIPLKLYK